MIRSRKPITPDNALRRLEDLCARSEQCSGEARKKLYNWGIQAKDTEQIISSLIERRFIDDRRYCRAFVRDKLMFSHWGKRKIKLSLIQKRIDRNIIDFELEQIDIDTYTDILKRIVLAKARTIKDADTYEGRTRLFRFAASRGFEPDLISKLIRDMAKNVK
ncbi:MAG: RecX family transcriptional regulator [Muribaculaceae bacterium]|nr:RecX family transcriptional regulator [Muribaculaceae bacterium]MDE5595168.1 RecX family transcriptional regulator [Muribaculaceae bacterium]MDE6703630.1 RecX family transcriptional regulator [Muribaculaceae bacterium]